MGQREYAAGTTDARGELAARLKLPDMALRGARLKVEVKSGTGSDTIEETVQVKTATRTLLSTDKPLYQPGQTLHIRAEAKPVQLVVSK